MPFSLTSAKTALNADNLLRLARQYDGPFWAYDAEIIAERIRQLRAFDIIRFAQKACSNVHILRLMRRQGVKVDAVSVGEIERALAAGYRPREDGIVFTADVLDNEALLRIVGLNITLNAGSPDMLHQLGERSPGHRVWLRINPGFGHGHSRKTNTGGKNSKHGIWYQDLAQIVDVIKRYDLQLAGLHMHIGSGVDYAHLQRVCAAMVKVVRDSRLDPPAISAGGGLSIPYREGEEPVNVDHYYALWNEARKNIAQQLGHPLTLEIEPGRFLVAQAGVMVAQVRAVKTMGDRHFVLVDAGFNDLMRPAMYGSYHRISLLAGDERKINQQQTCACVVAGPLCESGDVFTQRSDGQVECCQLPPARPGDYLVFHDTGAYGASMSSNYNSRPLIPEVLFEKGKPREIRRRQTMAELLALEGISL